MKELKGCEIELEFLIDKTYVESTRLPDWTTCMDENNHIWYGGYTPFFRDARLEFHEKLFISEIEMRALGTPIIMWKSNHEFPGETKYGDILKVVYGIYEMPDGVRINMMGRAYVGDKLVHVNPHIVCFKNLKTRKGTRIPKWYMETLEKYVV